MEKTCERIPAVVFLKDMKRTESLVVTHRFPFINAVGALVERSFFDASHENVVCAAKIHKVAVAKGSTDGVGVGVKRADFPPMRFAGRGAVAVIDTGIAQHLDFLMPKTRIKAFVDLVNGKRAPYDDNGHGTFISGVIAANGISSGGRVCGSAPDAELVGVKAMDADGEADTLKVLEAMQWVADNRARLKISVVCMSFGCPPVKNDPLARGAEALTANGVVVVCASGNSGEGKVLSPAVSDSVISVGACNTRLTPASFSSRGIIKGRYKPDFYALGVNVEGLSNKTLFTKMSGTSVACPYVAGVALRLRSFNPKTSPLEIRARLFKMAKYKDGYYYL